MALPHLSGFIFTPLKSTKMLRKSHFWNKSIDVPDKIDENPKSLGLPISGFEPLS
jgi:hypothetical protein